MTDPTAMPQGYTHVDQQDDPTVFVASMDATGQWPAVRRLRAWERSQLAVAPGARVLDVGCGAGDVLLDLAGVVGESGAAVGVDTSESMLAAARSRADAAGIAATFMVCDAEALDFEDGSFDIARSERTLQWVADPVRAVAEMVRVTRPGGRVCVIDTDWATLTVDHPSPEAAARFFDGLARLRGDQTIVGRRLVNLLRDAEVDAVEAAAETHLALTWDPDTQEQVPGFFPLRMIAGVMAEQGLLDAQDAETTIQRLEDAARRDRFFVSLTMFAATGVVRGS